MHVYIYIINMIVSHVNNCSFPHPSPPGQCGEGRPSAAEHAEGDRRAGGAMPGDV